MRCPYCRMPVRVGGRFCPRCGHQVLGPPSGGPAPPGLPGSPGSSTGDPPAVPAGAKVIGKTCPYCQTPIAAGTRVVVCPDCDTPHHDDCWSENGGCTTYACGASPAVKAAAHPSPGAYQQPTPYPPRRAGPSGPGYVQDLSPAMAVQMGELDRRATHALVYALLGLPCCAILSIVGFCMGLSVFNALGSMNLDLPSARLKATWALAVGVLVPIIWLILIAAGADSGSY